MIKVISKTSINAFEKEVNNFISDNNIVVDNIQYRTELESAREVSNFGNVKSTTYTTRHFAVVVYTINKKGD